MNVQWMSSSSPYIEKVYSYKLSVEDRWVSEDYKQAGESKKVNFIINEHMLRFYHKNIKYDVEAGLFRVYIGGDSSTQNLAEFNFNRSMIFVKASTKS